MNFLRVFSIVLSVTLLSSFSVAQDERNSVEHRTHLGNPDLIAIPLVVEGDIDWRLFTHVSRDGYRVKNWTWGNFIPGAFLGAGASVDVLSILGLDVTARGSLASVELQYDRVKYIEGGNGSFVDPNSGGDEGFFAQGQLLIGKDSAIRAFNHEFDISFGRVWYDYWSLAKDERKIRNRTYPGWNESTEQYEDIGFQEYFGTDETGEPFTVRGSDYVARLVVRPNDLPDGGFYIEITGPEGFGGSAGIAIPVTFFGRDKEQQEE